MQKQLKLSKNKLSALALVVGSFIVLLFIDHMITFHWRSIKEQEIHSQLEIVKSRFTSNLNIRLNAIEILNSQFAINPNTSYEDFVKFSIHLMKINPPVRAFQFADSSTRIQYTYPMEGNVVESRNLIVLRDDPVRGPYVRKAIELKRAVLQGPYPLRQGGTGIVIRSPIFTDHKFIGLAIGVYNLKDLLEEPLQSDTTKYGILLKDASGNLIFGNSEKLQNVHSENVQVADVQWTIGLGFYSPGVCPIFIKRVILWISGILIVLIITIIYLSNSRQKRRLQENISKRTMELSAKNEELKKEIEERKLTERKLQEKHELLTNLAKLVPGVIYQYRLYEDGRSAFPYASPGMMDIYEMTPEEVSEDATPVFGRLHPEDFDHVSNSIMESARTLETFYCEFRVILPRRGLRWRWSQAHPERLPDNSILWHGIILDITERKLAEEAMNSEKELLSVTLRSIGDGVITTDVHGLIANVNKTAELMTGWSYADSQGKLLSVLFKENDDKASLSIQTALQDALTKGTIINLENFSIRFSRNENEQTISTSLAPIKNAKSETVGAVLALRDVTEKQKLIESVQRAQKLESIGVLAGGIAHDFNNLLGGIFGYVDMAIDTIFNGDTSRSIRYLKNATGAFDRAKALTQQLLTFSKGGIPIRKTMQLTPLIKKNAQFALSGSNILCTFHFPDNLWLSDCDENQIGQVVDNIVINAKQAMPRGGTIQISGENVTIQQAIRGDNVYKGNFVHIAFKDEGSGIPKENLSKIFDPFFSTKDTGHGLGLATVYSIVRHHDGWIDVESEPGRGSTFHLYFPESKGLNKVTSASRVQTHKGRGSILVMDDEPFMREIIGDLLKNFGYTVVESKNGKEAVQRYSEALSSEDPIKACFFDLTIPGDTGGKDTAAAILKIKPDAIIIASSGYSEDPVMADPKKHGFSGKIIKPFRKDEMVKLLNQIFPGSDQT